MIRVLLVGEDVVQVYLLALLLERHRCQVTQSANLQAAFEELRAAPDIRVLVIVLSLPSTDRAMKVHPWLRWVREHHASCSVLSLSSGSGQDREFESPIFSQQGLIHLDLPQSPHTILSAVDHLAGRSFTDPVPTNTTIHGSGGDVGTSGHDGNRSRILVVDDDPMVTQVTAELLSVLHYDVTTVSSGNEAVAYCQLRSQPADLVLLDLMMPDMDGAACFECLRRLHPSLRILLSTGSDYDDDVVKTLIRQGAVGVVQKPYDIHELSEAVNNALSQPAAVHVHRPIPSSPGVAGRSSTSEP